MKGRVSIPAPFRRVLEEGDPDWHPGENPQLVLVYGSKEGRCLEGYSINSMDNMDDLIEALPLFSPEREYFETIMGADSEYASVDENGRIVLSQELRNKAGIEKDAQFVGKGNRFEIWQPAAYEIELQRLREWAANQDNPQALLQRPRGESA